MGLSLQLDNLAGILGIDHIENIRSENSSVVAYLFIAEETCVFGCCLAPLFQLPAIVTVLIIIVYINSHHIENGQLSEPNVTAQCLKFNLNIVRPMGHAKHFVPHSFLGKSLLK
jgi:hypothetical protein